MWVIGNLTYLVTGGILLVFGWLSAALLCWLFVVTRRLARPCLQVASLCLWPAGKRIVRESQVEDYREYIRTGSIRPGRPVSPRRAAISELILWLPMGVALSIGHFVHGLVMLLPMFTYRWANKNFGLVGACLFPFDIVVVGSALARDIQQPGRSKRVRIRSIPRRTERVVLAAPWRLAIMAAAATGFALWAPMRDQSRLTSMADKIAEEGTGNPLGLPTFLSKAEGGTGEHR